MKYLFKKHEYNIVLRTWPNLNFLEGGSGVILKSLDY